MAYLRIVHSNCVFVACHKKCSLMHIVSKFAPVVDTVFASQVCNRVELWFKAFCTLLVCMSATAELHGSTESTGA